MALATGVTLLFAVVHYALLDPGGATARWWGNAFWTLTSGLAAWQCLVAARGLDGSARRVRRCFGAGCGAWCAGMLAWSALELWGALLSRAYAAGHGLDPELRPGAAR